MKKNKVFKMFKIVMFIESAKLIVTFYKDTEEEARRLARGGEIAGYMTFIYDKRGEMLI